MSSQEIKSINERENSLLKEQGRRAGWTEEDLRAAFHEDERQDEAPWTKVRSVASVPGLPMAVK